MEQQGYQPVFVETYKGYEIFRIPTSAGDRHVAYERNDINPAARSKELKEIRGVLDVLAEEAARHAEADHLRDATKPIIAEV